MARILQVALTPPAGPRTLLGKYPLSLGTHIHTTLHVLCHMLLSTPPCAGACCCPHHPVLGHAVAVCVVNNVCVWTTPAGTVRATRYTLGLGKLSGRNVWIPLNRLVYFPNHSRMQCVVHIYVCTTYLIYLIYLIYVPYIPYTPLYTFIYLIYVLYTFLVW